MAFFSKPFAYNTHKDVQQLYEEAMDLGFSIDTTLPSEVASSALFTSDLPRVPFPFSPPAADSRPSSTFLKQILRLLCMYLICCQRAVLSMIMMTGDPSLPSETHE
jgi:hypothetical protein